MPDSLKASADAVRKRGAYIGHIKRHVARLWLSGLNHAHRVRHSGHDQWRIRGALRESRPRTRELGSMRRRGHARIVHCRLKCRRRGPFGKDPPMYTRNPRCGLPNGISQRSVGTVRLHFQIGKGSVQGRLSGGNYGGKRCNITHLIDLLSITYRTSSIPSLATI